MTNRILIDSGFLFALYNPRSAQFLEANNFIRRNRGIRLVPDVALTETVYLLKTHARQFDVLALLLDIADSVFEMVAPTLNDMRRVHAIMGQYADANLDFVDCCLMAVAAERLNITRICTFDRRDFSIYRRPDGSLLELLP